MVKGGALIGVVAVPLHCARSPADCLGMASVGSARACAMTASLQQCASQQRRHSWNGGHTSIALSYDSVGVPRMSFRSGEVVGCMPCDKASMAWYQQMPLSAAMRSRRLQEMQRRCVGVGLSVGASVHVLMQVCVQHAHVRSTDCTPSTCNGHARDFIKDTTSQQVLQAPLLGPQHSFDELKRTQILQSLSCLSRSMHCTALMTKLGCLFPCSRQCDLG